MEVSRITARGQTTIPKRIRERANLSEGDLLSFEIEDDHLLIHKISPDRDDYPHAVSEGLNEWTSREDEDAWRDL